MIKNDWEFINRWANKYKATKLLGGKCIKCDSNDFRILMFHHRGDDKEFDVSTLKTNRFNIMKQEIEKCVLLCPNCHHEYHYANTINSDDRHRKTKKTILEMKGSSKCCNCGYDKYIGSLDFHHKEKTTKLFTIGSVFLCSDIEKLGQILIDELEKCDILCKNCHAIKHLEVDRIEANIDEIKYKVWRENKKAPIETILKYHSLGYKNSQIGKELNIPMSTLSSILKRKKLIKN